MSDPKDKAIPEEIADAGSAAELAGDIPARGRGAPKKDPSLRLTESIRLSFTKDQYLGLIKAAADEGFTDLGAWMKSKLLPLVKEGT